MQDYSVGVNIYIGSSMRYTYTFSKILLVQRGKKTKMLYNLIMEGKGQKREELIRDLEILKKKVGIKEKGVRKEYGIE